MKIEIEVIENKDQRYPTVGDYWEDDAGIHIRVSRMGDWREEMLVAVHELVELLLMKQIRMPLVDSDDYDRIYERAREGDLRAVDELRNLYGCACRITKESEPGDDRHAPYYYQHQIATGFERTLAPLLHVDWTEYETDALDPELSIATHAPPF